MNSNPLTTGLVLAALLMGGGAFAQSNIVPGPQDYSKFSSFINERNIFDPARQPHYTSTYRPPRTRTRTRPTGTPGIQFVGTMSYEKGLFAFFNAGSPDLKKALPVGGKIAGFNVTEITTSGAILESADKKQRVALKVGDGLKPENGKWVPMEPGEMVTATGTSDSTGSTTPDNSGSSATPAAPTSAGEPNDILKRLMQNREKGN